MKSMQTNWHVVNLELSTGCCHLHSAMFKGNTKETQFKECGRNLRVNTHLNSAPGPPSWLICWKNETVTYLLSNLSRGNLFCLGQQVKNFRNGVWNVICMETCFLFLQLEEMELILWTHKRLNRHLYHYTSAFLHSHKYRFKNCNMAGSKFCSPFCPTLQNMNIKMWVWSQIIYFLTTYFQNLHLQYKTWPGNKVIIF